MHDTLNTRDIYLRHTSVDGKSHVAVHRVWDAERFIASQQQAASAENARQTANAPRKARVDQITEEQYRAAKAAH